MRSMLLPLLAATLLASAATEARNKPHVAEAVIATVDGRPIWLSDLRRLASTARTKLASVPAEQRAQTERELLTQLLDQLVERRLFELEASARQVQVSEREVDTALAAVAKQNGVDVPALLTLVKKEGMTEATYRAELRYQLVEAKLLRMRAEPWRKGETPAQATKRMLTLRTRWQKELREKHHVVLRVRP